MSGGAHDPLFGAGTDVINGASSRAPALYLIIAGFCLIVALRSIRQALAPIGVVVETVKATIVVAFSISVALVFLLAAALSS